MSVILLESQRNFLSHDTLNTVTSVDVLFIFTFVHFHYIHCTLEAP